MTHLRIHLSLVARFEGAEETVCASRNASALLNFAPHPIVFPLKLRRGRQKGRFVTAPMNNE